MKLLDRCVFVLVRRARWVSLWDKYGERAQGALLRRQVFRKSLSSSQALIATTATIDYPRRVVGKFDLEGQCNDDDCAYQHVRSRSCANAVEQFPPLRLPDQQKSSGCFAGHSRPCCFFVPSSHASRSSNRPSTTIFAPTPRRRYKT